MKAIVWSKPACVFCEKAKNLLKRKGIEDADALGGGDASEIGLAARAGETLGLARACVRIAGRTKCLLGVQRADLEVYSVKNLREERWEGRGEEEKKREISQEVVLLVLADG